jgi:hypothetical protein
MHKRQHYYASLARACDSLLSQHPLGTNSVIEIPISDPSVPAIISDLQPTMIQVSANRVWVMVGVREFAVSWEQQDSNHWAMTDIGEGVEQKVYVESRP